MMTRRQFLTGCAGAVATISAFSVFDTKKTFAHMLNSLPVLLYHRVGDNYDDLTVSPERFERDLQYLQDAGYQPITLDQAAHQYKEGIPLYEKPVLITFDDGYLDNYKTAFPLLQKYNMLASFFIITSMVGQENRMSLDQIREMLRYNMSFGSHTVSHCRLGEVSAADNLSELGHSKETLQQMLGRSVDFIAYPYGSYSNTTIDTANRIGYLGAFTTRSGMAHIADKNFALRRIPVFRLDRSLSFVIRRRGWIPALIS